MKLRPLACLVALLGPATLASLAFAAEAAVAAYRKVPLNAQFFSEGATFGDLKHDGKLDAISGPYWWEGPDFKVRHDTYPAIPWEPLRYSDNFFAFIHDFNGDGLPDILTGKRWWAHGPTGDAQPNATPVADRPPLAHARSHHPAV